MSEIAKSVGQRIRNYRTQQGLSQEKLAELSGCHPTYIGQLERGEKNATLESIEKIATALNVSLSKLFEKLGGQEDGTPDIPLECYEFLSAKTKEEQEHLYRMANVTTDDVRLALVAASEKSNSVYRSVHMLYKAIFNSAVDSNIIDYSPCERISAKGGKPQKDKEALTDEQIVKLLSAIKGLPPYVFVMIGLYAGLRREEILGLQWDSVYLDGDAPYISVRRAWHSEHNRPVISTELKTKAARRDIPIPKNLAECLREAKNKSTSDFVVANSEGGPLSYTQFKRVWQYIVTRSTKERTYVRYINGQKITKTVTPVLGEKAAHNGNVVYSLDFQVTPHQLRHTYITNLIYASVDPKTVQYLAGHENSKITMDIYAKVKYNKPEQLSAVVNTAFGQPA